MKLNNFEPGILIYGKKDDPRITLCQSVAEIISKDTNLKITFELYFETQFNIFRDNLIIKDKKILELVDCPLVYEVVNNTQ